MNWIILQALHSISSLHFASRNSYTPLVLLLTMNQLQSRLWLTFVEPHPKYHLQKVTCIMHVATYLFWYKNIAVVTTCSYSMDNIVILRFNFHPTVANSNRAIDIRDFVIAQLAILSRTKWEQLSWWCNISQCVKPASK